MKAVGIVRFSVANGEANIITGVPTRATAQRALKDGAHAYLAMQFPAENIRTAVNSEVFKKHMYKT